VRILAIQTKRIGDFVLTTPALHALKQAPGAHLSLVHTEATAALLPAMADLVDESLLYRPHGNNFALWKSVLRGSYDLCVDFTGRDRTALLALASRAPRRTVARGALRGSFWRRFCYNAVADIPVRERHTVDFYLAQAASALGLPPPSELSGPPPAPLLRLPDAAVAQACGLLSGQGIGADAEFIVVHPGSARPEKYWVPERWAEVIDFCRETLGRPCVLTGGSGDVFEQAHLARIHAALHRPCADLSGQLDLLSLAAVLARAAVFAGVDSGPMHLAAAFGRPQVVLFGPTNPFHWRPRQADCRVLQAGQGHSPVRDFRDRSPRGDLAAISTRAVTSCISEFLSGPA
jgi:ADP-heptose:LPS heptosyltransferase